MANFTNLQITNKGIDVELQAQGGAELEFTKFMVGDGTYTGAIKPLTTLVNPIMTLDVRRLNVSDEGTNKKVIVGFNINTEDVTTGFYLKEIGIYVKDPSTNQDVLAFYGNAGSNADYIAPSGSSTIAEKLIDIEINIDSVDSITAEIDSSLVYVTKSDIVDNLTSTDTDNPLSANQGKVLEDKKVNITDVVNDLTSTATNKPLSANQGKVLNDTKINITDITDNLTSINTNKPLSAKQGKVLNDNKINISDIVDNLTTDATNKPLSAKQGKELKSQVDGKAPTSHASSASTYGIGTPSVYGHTKVINNLTTNISVAGQALNAFQGYLLKQQLDNKLSIDGGDIDGSLTVWEGIFVRGNITVGTGSIASRLNSSNGNVTVGNQLFVDNSAIRSEYIYSNDTVSNAANMYITSNGWIRRTTNTSSRKYKKDIKELSNEELNPEKLYNLEIKQFKYKDEYQPNEADARYNKDLIGFIAEDLAEIYPVAVDYEEDENGNKIVDNWNERYLIPAMLKLIQDQKKQIDNLQSRVENLESKIN